MALWSQWDVAWTRDPKMLEVGPMSRLVYHEAALYCRENLTDGVIDRRAVAAFGFDIPSKKRHLDRLLEVGALEPHERGWQFPDRVWTRWNPLRNDVEDKRQAEADRKAAWREKKRHEHETARITSDQAESSDVPPVSQRDIDGTETSRDVPATGRDAQPEPEPEPKPKPEIRTTPSSLTPTLSLVVQEHAEDAPTFDQFWLRYPRKVSKVDARKLWDKLTPTEKWAAVNTIGDHVAAWASERPPRPIDKTMHPDRWLRGRHWEDDVGRAHQAAPGRIVNQSNGAVYDPDPGAWIQAQTARQNGARP
jgi:hypothetical protein